MNDKPDIPRTFAPDEQKIIPVSVNWDEEMLFAQEGMAFLPNVAKVIGMAPVTLIAHVRAYQEKHGNEAAYRDIGLRKIWRHWLVRLSVFGGYYRKYLKKKWRRVDPSWSRRQLLRQKGVFLLSEVAPVLGLDVERIRYRVKTRPEEDIGVFRDEETGRWLVEMGRLFLD